MQRQKKKKKKSLEEGRDQFLDPEKQSESPLKMFFTFRVSGSTRPLCCRSWIRVTEPRCRWSWPTGAEGNAVAPCFL